jgi:hypothetical protein
LTELVTLASGPHFVIAEESGFLDAIAVAIYGSWAARYEGVEGHPPHDADVLVIGEVPRRRSSRTSGSSDIASVSSAPASKSRNNRRKW